MRVIHLGDGAEADEVMDEAQQFDEVHAAIVRRETERAKCRRVWLWRFTPVLALVPLCKYNVITGRLGGHLFSIPWHDVRLECSQGQRQPDQAWGELRGGGDSIR